MSTTILKRDLDTGDLCDNIGLVGVSAKWSYVTASPSHHYQAIPILSPLLFVHVGHPYISLFKIQRIFVYHHTLPLPLSHLFFISLSCMKVKLIWSVHLHAHIVTNRPSINCNCCLQESRFPIYKVCVGSLVVSVSYMPIMSPL